MVARIANLDRVSVAAMAVALATVPTVATAQTAATSQGEETSSGLQEIVVTAEKRSARASDVGMSITAVSGESLRAAGVDGLRDFQKIDSSFSFGTTQSGTPDFTIRGVGFYDFALAASPAVSAYADEVPFAYAIMTRAADLDLERVEVLKGPQGTLFGQNSTGGAVNFIAARPTSEFEAGLEASYARFDAINVNGYLSGPLAENLFARLAFEADSGGAWQESYTRDDQLGDRRFARARLLTEWTPSDRLSVRVGVSYWRDRSDTQVGQLVDVPASLAAANNIALYQPYLLTYPLAPHDNQAADWDPAIGHRADQRFAQLSVRADYDIGENTTLTSISAYSDFHDGGTQYQLDGVNPHDSPVETSGEIRSYFQELRLAGESFFDSRLDWLIGASYADDQTMDEQFLLLDNTAQSHNFESAGGPKFNTIINGTENHSRTAAIFANLRFDLTDHLTLNAGARYTESHIDFEGCSRDTGDGLLAAGSNALQFLFKNILGLSSAPYVPAVAGGCITFDEMLTPGLFQDELDESNVSWRAGVDWKPNRDTLIYATASQGYKAGGYTTAFALDGVAYGPAVQESLMAYELGFKVFAFDRSLQVNGAYFHYDYEDKQFNSAIESAVFGKVFGLINVPESEVDGFELSGVWLTPLEGLTLNGSVTYLDAQVTAAYMNINQLTELVNYNGAKFPFSPEWSVLAGAQFEQPLASGAVGYARANYSWRSETTADFGYVPTSEIDSYGLLDISVGLRGADDRWLLEVFGRNVTDTYYWLDGNIVNNTAFRRTGMPATYGIRVNYQFH